MREMKDSGVEWAGWIPKDWNFIKLKYLFDDSNAGEVIDKTYWNIGNELLYTCQKEPMLSNYSDFPDSKRTTNRDLLLTRNATPYIFIPEVNAIYSNVVQRIRVCNKYDRRYIKYALTAGVEALTVNGDTIPSYNMEVWKNIAIAELSLEEQISIINYLDEKCTKIDAIIESQQAVIDSIRQYKQRVITEGVRGQHLNYPLERSRYFWVGQIPMAWKVGQLKYFAQIRSGVTLGKKYPMGTELIELPYLRVANVQGEYVDTSDVATIMVTADEATKYALHKNELLMTEGGDRDKLGRGCVWNAEIEPCLHQNHVFAVTTDSSKLDVHYLDYVTTSDIARTYFDYTAKKTTNLASTNSTMILQFRLPIPPLKEQKTIVESLDKKCAELNKMIQGKMSIIEKLKQYKKSLIYEVVTGKKEV